MDRMYRIGQTLILYILPIPVKFSPGLTLAALDFDFGFECDDEVAYARLVDGLDEAERFVEDAALVLGPVGLARDAAEFARIPSGARRSRLLDDFAVDGEHHRRDARRLNRARGYRHRLGAEPLGGEGE